MLIRSRFALARLLVLLVAAVLLAACTPAASPTPGAGTPGTGTPGTGTPGTGTPGTGTPGTGTPTAGTGEGGDVIMLSTQLNPTEEQEKFRNVILADYQGNVDFVPATAPEFADRTAAEAQAGEGAGQVGVLGGLHGDLEPLADNLTDLSDLAQELGDLGFNEAYLELGRLGTDQQLFIPWMQATYIVAARQEAMEFLPEGADQNALTYEDLAAWGRNIADAGNGQRLGFPAGPEGLWHRFFQGFGIPAYTGAVNTQFRNSGPLWEWLRETWQYVNPQSTGYSFMQEPLQAGEVWVAWDHVARLRDAFVNSPDEFVAMPAPAGPQGRAFMPVVAGLAIPRSAPDPEAARNLIRYLVQPETAALTLQEVGFFPPTQVELPELDPGLQGMATAVSALTNAEDALPARLPVGLGDQAGAYNQVFRDAFESIVIRNEDIQQVLEREATNLQNVLNTAEAACWPPDPPSEGPCQVE
ncbi:MAG: ABC transporter substrate-binding protein [Chloroflexota bacterium]|nr:ABC transporter substrate-binding protein [Chloroflexota bacterium]